MAAMSNFQKRYVVVNTWEAYHFRNPLRTPMGWNWFVLDRHCEDTSAPDVITLCQTRSCADMVARALNRLLR